jgi:DNA-directed RNA polymerase subunit RPC12/RpoP
METAGSENKPTRKRHLDKGRWLLSWANEVEVLCPRCGEHGLLTGDAYYKNWHGHFTCMKCAYQARTDTTGWVGEVEARGRRRCPDCGTKWIHVSKTYSSPSNSRQDLMGTCPHCKKRNQVHVEIWPSVPYDHSVDPFLGLELALKERTRHGDIWVYNATHLAELKVFISASLREDCNKQWSYFSRLPTWIKSAKNRDEVLRAVVRLESRALTRFKPRPADD